jgi:hypothetical protein
MRILKAQGGVGKALTAAAKAASKGKSATGKVSETPFINTGLLELPNVNSNQILTKNRGFSSYKLPKYYDTTDWRPAYDIWTSFLKEHPLSEFNNLPPLEQYNTSKKLGNQLKEKYPFGFNENTFAYNFYFYGDRDLAKKNNFFDVSPERFSGTTLIDMGRPETHVDVPEIVRTFYENDVIPRIKDYYLKEKTGYDFEKAVRNALNEGATQGYVPSYAAAVYRPFYNKIVLSNRSGIGSNHVDSDFVHELHHKYRTNLLTEGLKEVYTPYEKQVVQPFEINSIYARDPFSEITATAAENRFDYWKQLYQKNKNVKYSDMDFYIDEHVPADKLISNLAQQNGYEVTPRVNGNTHYDADTPDYTTAGDLIRELINYVPAMSAPVILSNTLNTNNYANTKQ